MGRNITAIIPAAGLGKRFGGGTNKPFLTLGGLPLIIWALRALEEIDDITEMVPVFKSEEMAEGLDLIGRYGITKVKQVVPGGKERQDSVYNGLSSLDTKTDIVVIHDGVRPLVEKSLIKEAIRQIDDADGVIAAVPVKDTIKTVRAENIVQETLDRKSLWAVQTPQVFKYPLLTEAYRKAVSERFYSTDDSAIMERYGGKVKVIMGSYANIKITTPEDIDMAEIFLRKKEKA